MKGRILLLALLLALPAGRGQASTPAPAPSVACWPQQGRRQGRRCRATDAGNPGGNFGSYDLTALAFQEQEETFVFT